MIARVALAAALFALAAAAPTAAQPPKKAVPKTAVPAKIDPAKIAAAQKALTAIGCVVSPDRKIGSPTFGQLKQVTFPATTNDDDFGAALPHLLALPALTTLDLGRTQLTDAGAAQLARLPKLEAVFLDGVKVGPKALAALAELPDLHWLDLAEYDAAGVFRAGKADVAALGKLARLQHLSVALAPGLTAADLEPFNGLGGLRELSVFGGGPVGVEGVRHLTSPRQLTTLNLGSVPIGDDEAKVVGELASLKSLTFAGGGLTDAGVQSLTGLRSVTALYLYGPGLTLSGVTGFGEMKALTRLSVAGANVTDAGLQRVFDLPALASLDLSGTKVTFEGVTDLKKRAKLTGLTIAASPVTDEGLKNVSTLPALSYLALSGTAATDAGLKHVAKLRTLATLALTHNPRAAGAPPGGITGDGLKNLSGSNVRTLTTNVPIDGADLKGLAGCKSLTELWINGTPTDDAALKGLTGVRTLRNVWAVDTKATAAGKAAVERAVPGCVVHLEYARGVAGPAVRAAGARTTSP